MEARKLTKFNQCCLLFCWKSDDLEMFGRLPVRGYCPGQTMNLKLDVVNKSVQDVSYFLVRFIQVRKRSKSSLEIGDGDSSVNYSPNLVESPFNNLRHCLSQKRFLFLLNKPTETALHH